MRIKINKEGLWALFISKDFKENLGDKPICQNCAGDIISPFFICRTSKKWYCYECEHKNDGKDQVETDFCAFRKEDHHEHVCISEVIEEEDGL